jgi:hypothetical protein
MFNNSVISRSGQMWKLMLAVIALLVGSFAPLAPVTGITWTSGTVIAIVGYLYGMVAIRCGNCKRMWFWEAAKDAGLYGPLFKGHECPNCQHSYS